eukprot:CAMPEP_0174897104 /NCGR_PEP_ID=MMETSP0167-20121228/11667_1 /TAXON_ID=38298 /ORGANISM="Rhodella maculata, Strain CCMP736" /LENGTH=55 /DNA_ID=CAMNT_0016136865 /DNA_START=1 /DNA_END=166 /DNA_ORIENTATION=+
MGDRRQICSTPPAHQRAELTSESESMQPLGAAVVVVDADGNSSSRSAALRPPITA